MAREDYDAYAGGSPGDLSNTACELGLTTSVEAGCDEVREMGTCELGTEDRSEGRVVGSNSGGGGAFSGF